MVRKEAGLCLDEDNGENRSKTEKTRAKVVMVGDYNPTRGSEFLPRKHPLSADIKFRCALNRDNDKYSDSDKEILSSFVAALDSPHPLVVSLSDSYEVGSSRTKIARLDVKVGRAEAAREKAFQSGTVANINARCSLKQFPACGDADTRVTGRKNKR